MESGATEEIQQRCRRRPHCGSRHLQSSQTVWWA